VYHVPSSVCFAHAHMHMLLLLLLAVHRYLADRDLPIWVSLAQGHLELYREIQTVRHTAGGQAGCAGLEAATP
jgi:hypothetical protein